MVRIVRCALVLSVYFGVLQGAAHTQNKVKKILVGGAEVKMLHRHSGNEKLSKPDQTLVYQFDVPTEVITIDKSVAAHILNHDPIAHVKGDAGQASDPLAVAGKIQATFSKKLLAELKKGPLPAVSIQAASDAKPPAGALTIRGEFTAVNQGRKTARMLIGFGRGASDVKAHVTVSLVRPDQILVLAEFDMNSRSGKQPGAAATMGIGSPAVGVASSAAGDRKATVEGDTSRMAKAVAQELRKIVADEGWIPNDKAQPEAQPSHQ